MPTHRELIMPKGEPSKEMSPDLNIKYMVSAFGGGEEITEDSLNQLVNEIREGQNVGTYLSQDPDLEGGTYMLVETDNGLIFFQYVENDGTKNACSYASFDPDYLDSEDESPIRCSDGQSVILMRYTMHDPELAARCVEYFVRTGKLYPGMAWLKGWTDWEM